MTHLASWLTLGALTLFTLNCGSGTTTGSGGSASSSASAGGAGGSSPTTTTTSSASGTGGAPSTASASSSSAGGQGGQGGATTATSTSTTSAASSSSGPPPCMPSPNQDLDQDGYTPNQGDCDDCDPNVNPAAAELANALDDDCDGLVDNVPPPCDQAFAVDDNDPANAAKAVELCKPAIGPKDWGLVSAKWTLPDGAAAPVNPKYDLGHGLVSGFGPNVHVQAGLRMLDLSSGTARQPTDPGYADPQGYDKGYSSNGSPGLPDMQPSCPGTLFSGLIRDAVALEVSLRAPSNAHGFAFDLDFFSYEWPDYVCSQYDDLFAAIMSPPPPGAVAGDIAFDMQSGLISVNGTFLDVCGCAGNPPGNCNAGGKSFACSLGDSQLAGNGYMPAIGDRGATGWLTTTAPVSPGQTFTLRWTDYDSGDSLLDSATMVDNFRWLSAPTTVGTTRIQNPK